MASIAFANIAAAQSGGYAIVRTDRGASGADASERYFTMLEKYVGGLPGDPAGYVRAYGYGASQAAADAAALASVNVQRANRYGSDSASPNSTAHGIAPNAAGGASGPGKASGGAQHAADNT